MKINTYLPDEIGDEAKAKGLNLSRLLRDAVITELRWQRAESDGTVETYEVPILLDDEFDGQVEAIGRITGRRLHHDEYASLYLVDDERAIIVWGDNTVGRYDGLEDAVAEMGRYLLTAPADISTYVELCRLAGVKPVIDL